VAFDEFQVARNLNFEAWTAQMVTVKVVATGPSGSESSVKIVAKVFLNNVNEAPQVTSGAVEVIEGTLNIRERSSSMPGQEGYQLEYFDLDEVNGAFSNSNLAWEIM
jgi:hypothetical protein